MSKKVEVGAHGVQLKLFELVVKNLLLSQISVEYSNLPPLPTKACQPGETNNSNWPFNVLPQQAQVYGCLPGQISNEIRARRKEDQLRNMIHCVLFLLEQTQPRGDSHKDLSTTTTLVDWGGGSGHLAIPLALLMPHCRVIVVDLSDRSLDLLHEKTRIFASNLKDWEDNNKSNAAPRAAPLPTSSKLKVSLLPNLYTFHGPVQEFDVANITFDVGIALHLCGEATDVALRKCGQAGARAIVFCPCCVGKLNVDRKNPYIWQSTGSNAPTVEYPQSSTFQQCFSTDERQKDWNALAKAADYGDAEQSRTQRNAARRCAKALLETDRLLFLKEAYGYQTALTRMEPWESSPKNDLILAWKPHQSSAHAKEAWSNRNEACHKDIETTKLHLFDVVENSAADQSGLKRDAVDWTVEEEQAIHSQIQGFFFGEGASATANEKLEDEPVLLFPKGMGRRQRKLIHYVAAQLKLEHWSVLGNGKGEKTVAVGRKRRRLTPSDQANAQIS